MNVTWSKIAWPQEAKAVMPSPAAAVGRCQGACASCTTGGCRSVGGGLSLVFGPLFCYELVSNSEIGRTDLSSKIMYRWC